MNPSLELLTNQLSYYHYYDNYGNNYYNNYDYDNLNSITRE